MYETEACMVNKQQGLYSYFCLLPLESLSFYPKQIKSRSYFVEYIFSTKIGFTQVSDIILLCFISPTRTPE